MAKQQIDVIWNILNKFRTKNFISEPTAEINIGDFDKMLDEIQLRLDFQ